VPIISYRPIPSSYLLVIARAAVTEKFVEYLAYKATYENAPPNEDIPDFLERIDPEIALELYVQTFQN
jgi:hypothetical protein